jgi:hypothetical protein
MHIRLYNMHIQLYKYGWMCICWFHTWMKSLP